MSESTLAQVIQRLQEKWRQQATDERQYPPHASAVQWRGISGVLEMCADELSDALLAAARQEPVDLDRLVRDWMARDDAVLVGLPSTAGWRKPSENPAVAEWLRQFAEAVLGATRREPPPEGAPDTVLDIYVPGAWKCPKCQFQLSQATLFVGSGEVGCTRDQVMRLSGESCPNDGEPMARVTWRERAIENQQWGESLMEEIIAAVGAEHLPGALARIKELGEAARRVPEEAT